MTKIYLLLLPIFLCRCLGKQSQDRNTIDNKVNNVAIQARFIKNENVNDASHNDAYDIESHESYLHFNIRLEQPSFEPNKKTLEYLDYRMQDDFKLVEKGDTLLPVLAQRIVNGQKGKYEYIVVFENTSGYDKNSLLQIIYEDKIFGIGRQIFEFKKQDLLNSTKS